MDPLYADKTKSLIINVVSIYFENFDFWKKYIGISGNISNRLDKHNSGSVRSTKAYSPWELVYKEEFKTKKEARIKELELKKSGNKRKELLEMINEALSSIG